MKVLLRAVLFFDALLDLLLGILLLASPFTTLYAALQLPQPQPALFGQLLGVATIGLSWLLFQATINGQLTVAVARTTGYVNLVSALLVTVWTLFLDIPVQGVGKVWLLTLAAVLIFLPSCRFPRPRRCGCVSGNRPNRLRSSAKLARPMATPRTTNPACPARRARMDPLHLPNTGASRVSRHRLAMVRAPR
jgi:hypothetical protein